MSCVFGGPAIAGSIRAVRGRQKEQTSGSRRAKKSSSINCGKEKGVLRIAGRGSKKQVEMGNEDGANIKEGKTKVCEWRKEKVGRKKAELPMRSEELPLEERKKKDSTEDRLVEIVQGKKDVSRLSCRNASLLT